MDDDGIDINNDFSIGNSIDLLGKNTKGGKTIARKQHEIRKLIKSTNVRRKGRQKF